jgi:uncharacterized protein (TIRG00374 family)
VTAGPPISEAADPAAPIPRWSRRRVLRRAAFLTITGLSLYAVAPSLVGVLKAGPEVIQIQPWWLVSMLVLEAGTFFCLWRVQEISLRATRLWPVAVSQLAGNAFSRIVPGGAATAGALQYRMLLDAGIESAAAASGLTASNLLLAGMLLSLPVLSLPAVLAGEPINADLARAAWAGLFATAVMGVGGTVLLTRDGPVEWVGRTYARIRNALFRRRAPLDDVPARLVRERNLIRAVLGDRWQAALLFTSGRWGLDYLALVAALGAVGHVPLLYGVLLAYCVAQILAVLPFTPGGLGFVEAGLTGTLALAGVDAADAVVATLAYRLVSYWLPLPAGLIGWFLYRRRYAGDPVVTDGGY